MLKLSLGKIRILNRAAAPQSLMYKLYTTHGVALCEASFECLNEYTPLSLFNLSMP
jgi:hypothetical protein